MPQKLNIQGTEKKRNIKVTHQMHRKTAENGIKKMTTKAASGKTCLGREFQNASPSLSLPPHFPPPQKKQQHCKHGLLPHTHTHLPPNKMSSDKASTLFLLTSKKPRGIHATIHGGPPSLPPPEQNEQQ